MQPSRKRLRSALAVSTVALTGAIAGAAALASEPMAPLGTADQVVSARVASVTGLAIGASGAPTLVSTVAADITRQRVGDVLLITVTPRPN